MVDLLKLPIILFNYNDIKLIELLYFHISKNSSHNMGLANKVFLKNGKKCGQYGDLELSDVSLCRDVIGLQQGIFN